MVKFTPREHPVFQAFVLHATSRERNLDLQAKNVYGKDEKQKSKTFMETHIRLSL